ncbi:protein transport protein Sec24A [Drosophila tropicalis]|uniref:protein transport protein Sec24A n=2 Tax=Drosophila tropicalis TaxID=46794 RepID=UPI0035ABCDCC
MSAYNANIVPPPMAAPPNGNQFNGQSAPAVAPPPMQYQQQQPVQQKLPLQQQQQYQQPPPPVSAYQQPGVAAPTVGNLPPPPLQFNSNVINKFLPPVTTTAASPVAAPPGPNGLPPHLRPAPTLNGPPSMINGSNGAHSSANSSRTASPGLMTTAPKPPPPTNVANLTNNLQNLNLQPTNGISGPPTTQQQQQLAHKDYRGVAVASGNNPTQLDTSGANSLISASGLPAQLPLPNHMASPFSATNKLISSGPLNSNSARVFGNAAPAAKPPQSSGQKILYGVQATPEQQQQQQQLQQQNQQNNNLQRPPQTAPPPTAASQAWQPTQLMRPPVPGVPTMQPLQPAQAPPPLAKPPLAGGPLPPQQQQPGYPYGQAYAQQTALPPPPTLQPPPPTGGVFGVQQPNQAPLQYQTQPPPPPVQQPYGASNPAAAAASPMQFAPMNVTQQGFSQLWGQDTIDLMQNRHILSPATLQAPKIVLHNQFQESINCSPNIMRCTLTKIPESNSLLQKSRLPLGIVIHPFRDVNSLPVIQCINIVRCRLCRTYINPFVYFVDSKMWKCNLCYRVNELPEDFQFDPATKTYGDVTRRPEVRSSTIEFIAPSEYMLRPPQPAMYLFLFDVSIIAQQSGYLETACATLSRHLDEMPGDARTQVGFICYDSFVHFYSMADGLNQPHEMTLLDIDDPFLPRPDSLLVNLKECKELVKDLLKQLPKRFAHTHDPGSALGAALQVAFKLMQASGGRITVFQSCLPNKGPGSLEPREDPNNRSSKDVAHLNPATDFYKRYALECSGYQIACDLFLMNQQYSDMATISGISKHSGGCVHHFPLYQKSKPHMVDSFRMCFKRYLTRKIGFEAVMRIRCTRGLQVHTFHGNFFVRSTDLLSLPNVNPDAGFGMQISYEENLSDVKTICFQAALLYTNSEGERRIRVHTVCLPVTASLPEVMHSADTEAIIGLLSKMAVDRSIASNLSDARDAFINATIDVFNAFKIAQNLPSGQSGQLIAPRSLALMPMYILAMLKHPAFRVGTSTRLDDRVYAMDCMKTLPLDQLMKYVYPELYKIDALIYHARNSNVSSNQQEDEDDDDEPLPDLPRLQLSAEHLDSRSIFLMDCGTLIMLYVGLNVPVDVLEAVLDISSTAELADYVYGLPTVASAENDVLKRFILRLNYDKPYGPLVQIIRDTSLAKGMFIERLTDDRSESSLSYYEFLQHIRAQVK